MKTTQTTIMIKVKKTSMLMAMAIVVAPLLLTACGGGGSSTPPAAGVTPPPTPVEVAQTAKTRALEGLDVVATPYALSTATTKTTRVEISVSDPTLVSSLTASIGKDFESAAAVTATQSSTTGKWSLSWPAGVATDSGLLIVVNLKSGDILETGLTDFQFQ